MNKIIPLVSLILVLSACSLVNPPQTDDLESGVQTVSGVVLGGGDQTPEGLLDAPRKFVYQVKLDSGEEIDVTYTAYPPSPATDEMPRPQLTFHAGEILIGDAITARGTYDAETKTLTVALDTDFIETQPGE